MVVGIVRKDLGLDAGGLLHAVILEDGCDFWVDALKLVPCLVLGHCCYYNSVINSICDVDSPFQILRFFNLDLKISFPCLVAFLKPRITLIRYL